MCGCPIPNRPADDPLGYPLIGQFQILHMFDLFCNMKSIEVKTMKALYELAEIEVVKFSIEDVITTSTETDPTEESQNPGPGGMGGNNELPEDEV